MVLLMDLRSVKMKTEQEINDMLDKTYDKVSSIEEGETGGNFGMTYEDGVKTALEWVNEYSNEEPIEE